MWPDENFLKVMATIQHHQRQHGCNPHHARLAVADLMLSRTEVDGYKVERVAEEFARCADDQGWIQESLLRSRGNEYMYGLEDDPVGLVALHAQQRLAQWWGLPSEEVWYD